LSVCAVAAASAAFGVLVVEAQVTTKIKEFTHVRDDGHLR
jgi:hypothetical protein